MRRDLQRNHRVHSPLAASIFISILILLSALIVNLEHKADLVVYLALFHISMDVFCTEWLCSYIGPMIGQLLTHNENTLRSHVFSFLFSIFYFALFDSTFPDETNPCIPLLPTIPLLHQ